MMRLIDIMLYPYSQTYQNIPERILNFWIDYQVGVFSPILPVNTSYRKRIDTAPGLPNNPEFCSLNTDNPVLKPS